MWHSITVSLVLLDIVTDSRRLKKSPALSYPQLRLPLLSGILWSLTVLGGTWLLTVSGFIAASNNTEVGLRLADNSDTDYVTSLVPRGSSTSIVAVSHVSANTMRSG